MSGVFAGMDDLSNVPTVGPLPDGEYNVRLAKLVLGTSANSGAHYLRVEADFPDEPNALPLSSLVCMIPEPTDESSQARRNRSDLKAFMEGFGLVEDWPTIREELEATGVSTSVAGVEAICQVVLRQREGQRPENSITGFVA